MATIKGQTSRYGGGLPRQRSLSQGLCSEAPFTGRLWAFDTVDGRNPAPVDIWFFFQGFNHPFGGAGFLPSTVWLEADERCRPVRMQDCLFVSRACPFQITVYLYYIQKKMENIFRYYMIFILILIILIPKFSNFKLQYWFLLFRINLDVYLSPYLGEERVW